MSSQIKVLFVILNLNGWEDTIECVNSILLQSEQDFHILLIDNGSNDESAVKLAYFENNKKITFFKHSVNLGFAGGVNVGIRYAIDKNYEAVALFNNDAVADKHWLKHLVGHLDENTGIVTGCLQSIDKQSIDSTGDQLTIWGLPFPRGRGTKVTDNPYTTEDFVFGASGGASIYSVAMLKEVGLFDEDFFAYYEDVDISFRAQLAGWKVKYIPEAIAYHHIGATSSKIKGFTVYQTFKNLPWLYVKNVPYGLIWTMGIRFKLAYLSFFASAVMRGQGLTALRGVLISLVYLPKKLGQRWKIQSRRKVSAGYINTMLTHDLPENSTKLRALRNKYWKIRGKI